MSAGTLIKTQLEVKPVVDTTSAPPPAAEQSTAAAQPASPSTTIVKRQQPQVVARRSAGTSPFARAVSKEDVLALNERTRAQRKADPKAGKCKYYNQVHALVLAAKHIDKDAPLGKSGKTAKNAFNKYRLLITSIPLTEQNMPDEVGKLECVPNLPTRLLLVKRVRWSIVQHLPGVIKQKPVPLKKWVPEQRADWEYMELSEGKAISFSDYNNSVMFQPGTRVRLIDVVAQDTDGGNPAGDGEGGAPPASGAFADNRSAAAAPQVNYAAAASSDVGGGGGGDDVNMTGGGGADDGDAPQQFSTHHFKAYMQPIEADGGSGTKVPFGSLLMLQPATRHMVTHVMEMFVKRQLALELNPPQAGGGSGAQVHPPRTSIEEIVQMNARSTEEKTGAYAMGDVDKAYSFVALTDPVDDASLIYSVNNGEKRLANYACVAEGVQRAQPGSGEVDFLYLLEMLFKSETIYDIFGTPNPDKWAAVGKSYMTLIPFFALLSIDLEKSLHMFLENGKILNEYMARFDLEKIRAGEVPAVVDLFADRIYVPETNFDYKAFAYVNLVFMDPNQLWNWTIPVTSATLDKIEKRWHIAEGARVDATKFREDPHYCCISELPLALAKSRYGSDRKQAAGEYRVMIANPQRFLANMPALCAATPEQGSQFVESICFFDQKGGKPPRLPAYFAQPPFNLEADQMIGYNLNAESQCIAYVFSDSETWRKFSPEKYTVNSNGEAVEKPAAPVAMIGAPPAAAATAPVDVTKEALSAGLVGMRAFHQEDKDATLNERYDRERDRSPLRTQQQDASDPFADPTD